MISSARPSLLKRCTPHFGNCSRQYARSPSAISVTSRTGEMVAMYFGGSVMAGQLRRRYGVLQEKPTDAAEQNDQGQSGDRQAHVEREQRHEEAQSAEAEREDQRETVDHTAHC